MKERKKKKKNYKNRIYMKGYYRWWQAAVCAVSIFLLFCAGCAAGEEDASSIQENRTEGGTSEDKKAIELEVMFFFDLNTPGTYYLDLWEQYAQKYGYDLTTDPCSTEEIKDKLQIALACAELPDIFAVWGGEYPNYLFDANACIPVQDYLQQSAFQYKDSYVVPYKDGNNYIIPCLVEAYSVMYCNQNLLKMMELEVPQTWEELLGLVETVNHYNERHGTSYSAIQLGDKDSWLGELLYDVIVNRIDPYAFDALAAGELRFDEAPVFAEAADKIIQLADLGAFPEDYMETGEVEAIENFVNNESVLFPHQSTIVNYLLDHMGDTAFTLESFPCCSEEFDPDYTTYIVDINHTLTPGLCISSDTKYPEEAIALCMEFAQEVNRINVTEYGYLNMEKDSTLEAPEELALPALQLVDLVEHAEKFTAFWYAVMDKEDGDDWRNLTKKLLSKAISKEDFLKEGQKYW